MAAVEKGGKDRRRVIIEGVRPEVDCGRFPCKRVVGSGITVEADIFTDGHEAVSAQLLYRFERDRRWQTKPMEPLGNDRWRASFTCERLGRYVYTVEAWLDPWQGWRRDMHQRIAAAQDIGIDLIIGGKLIEAAAGRATGRNATSLLRRAEQVLDPDNDITNRTAIALEDETDTLVSRYPDVEHCTRHDRELVVAVDPVAAECAAWYELFPRSTALEPNRHGTFADVERRLDYVAELGFDVLYLPPIHPIGMLHRKGRNNAGTAEPDDVGSPWAIGSAEGGHMSIHPELGTLDAFRQLVANARARGIEIALDIAFQVAPDHPYVREHPTWFRTRPDGTVQYAENPPKKYQDIYPFDFESSEWRTLWQELSAIFEFWIDQGVHIFRVDNPHTKPFGFWEWCIARLRSRHPDTIFLAEAFTTPRRMERLAKLGFNQSYTYFAWRNSKRELVEYMTELTTTDVAEYFRPNLWPNTPDILNEYLQSGERAAFMARVVLAATLSASWGIYGPAYELMEHVPREPGSEEYLDSEKYELRSWDLERSGSLRHLVARLNQIRKSNSALHDNRTLRFHAVNRGGADVESIIAYTKSSAAAPVTPTGRAIYSYEHVVPPAPGPDNNVILTIVNLDPLNAHDGWVELPLGRLGIDAERPYTATDLLDGTSYTWHGVWNYIELDTAMPAHVFHITQARD